VLREEPAQQALSEEEQMPPRRRPEGGSPAVYGKLLNWTKCGHKVEAFGYRSRVSKSGILVYMYIMLCFSV
jgi:hypothetical protein